MFKKFKIVSTFLIALGSFSTWSWAQNEICLSWSDGPVCQAAFEQIDPTKMEVHQESNQVLDNEIANPVLRLGMPELSQETPDRTFHIGATTSFSENVNILRAEGGILFFERFRLRTSIPYLFTDNSNGMGDAYLGMEVFYRFLRNKIISVTSGGTRIPTGDDPVTFRKTQDLIIGQELLWQTEQNWLFASVSYILKGQDEFNYNEGDLFSSIIGADFTLPLDWLRVYSAIVGNIRGNDTSQGFRVQNGEQTIDLLIGTSFWDYQIRTGLMVPVQTESEYRTHSDRKLVLEASTRLVF